MTLLELYVETTKLLNMWPGNTQVSMHTEELIDEVNSIRYDYEVNHITINNHE